jgi:hypothetical protein
LNFTERGNQKWKIKFLKVMNSMVAKI